MRKPFEVIRGTSRNKNAERTQRPKIKLDKKRVLAIGGCTLLIAAAVWLNVALSAGAAGKMQQAQATPDFLGDEVPANLEDGIEEGVASGEDGEYFAVFRQNRTATREKELEYLKEMMADKNTTSEAMEAAQAQRLALIEAMEKEMLIEGLLAAKGFDRVAVTVKQGSVNIVVDRESLSDTEVAQILDIAISESGESPDNIKVMRLG